MALYVSILSWICAGVTAFFLVKEAALAVGIVGQVLALVALGCRAYLQFQPTNNTAKQTIVDA